MSETMNKKLTVLDIMKGIAASAKDLFANTLTDQQKLDLIEQKLEDQVAEMRASARTVGAQMRALADPSTNELEKLEALQARRAKLVELGGKHLGDAAKLVAIRDEITGLDQLIAANQATYDTLKDAYGVAKGNYDAALSALEKVRGQGQAILAAIAAHRNAQEIRDAANDATSVDVSFMDDLAAELSQVKAEARADEDLDADLDASNSFNIDAALKADETTAVDAALMAEFQAAAGKKAA